MTSIALENTVAAIAAELPGAAELFRRHDISFCCGGNVPLSEAAIKAGLAPSELLSELEALREAARRDAPEETSRLIANLLDRYHKTHRAELTWLIPLAQKVERVHGDHPLAPIGLSQVLERLRDELESHMMKEEQVLFPMMQRGGIPMIAHQMRHKHEDEVGHLRTIEHVTHGLSLPPDACGSWTALYTGLRKFTDDLVTHMHLENAVLFPRFETQSLATG
jgi:regulator of cell morphogenesis and NO signaling